MVNEVVMDTAIEVHREVRSSRMLCDSCKTLWVVNNKWTLYPSFTDVYSCRQGACSFECLYSQLELSWCGLLFRSVHVPLTAAAAGSSLRPPSGTSRAPSPSASTTQDSNTGGDTGASSGSKADGVSTLECTVCQQVVCSSFFIQSHNSFKLIYH